MRITSMFRLVLTWNYIRIKKEYTAVLIADLIKVHAVEAVEENESIELTTRQKEALDRELTIDEQANAVNILRIFNTCREPLY